MRIEETQLFFIYAETPLHPGAGTGLGAIDNPVQREVTTGLPLIPASMVKGSLRSEFDLWATASANEDEKRQRQEKICAVFGPTAKELSPPAAEPEEKATKKKSGLYASAVAFTDARLLAFPVRVPSGMFIWTVCPFTIERLKRDLDLVPPGIRPNLSELPKLNGDGALVSSANLLGANGTGLAIEDILLESAKVETAVKIFADWLAENLFAEDETYWRALVSNRLALIPDEVFADLTVRCTEIVTRTKLKEGEKIVDDDVGGLWTEEYIPAESIFYSLALLTKPSTQARGDLKSAAEARKFLQETCPARFQLGGDETVGRGFIRLRMHIEKPAPGTNEKKEASHAAK